MNNKELLYSSGNYIQPLVITYNRKEVFKKNRTSVTCGVPRRLRDMPATTNMLKTTLTVRIERLKAKRQEKKIHHEDTDFLKKQNRNNF